MDQWGLFMRIKGKNCCVSVVGEGRREEVYQCTLLYPCGLLCSPPLVARLCLNTFLCCHCSSPWNELLPGYPLEPHWRKCPDSPFRFWNNLPITWFHHPAESFCFLRWILFCIGTRCLFVIWLFSLEYSTWVITSRSPLLCQLWLSVALLCWPQEQAGPQGLISDVLHGKRKRDGNAFAAFALSSQCFSLLNHGCIGTNEPC